MQVVYDDVRNHGRSERRDALGWKLELCADDLRAFRDTRSRDPNWKLVATEEED